MATFFTADTHFGHAGARTLYRRPFATTAEMDDGMRTRWNSSVGPDDDVYHLGDFAVRHKDPAALLATLHGRKHLVAGNNDPEPTRALPAWTTVQDYLEFDLDGTRLVLCHYPFRTWRDMSRGAWNLHGHSHGRLARMPRQVDVGVDAWSFTPVALTAILGSRQRGAASAP